MPVGGFSMKTPSGILAIVILATIMIVVVVGCVTQLVPNQQALLEIGTKTTYVEWKDQGQFDSALAQICQHGGYYDLTVLMKVGDQHIHPYKPCPFPVNIRTVKVTKSKVADGAAAGDPHVTMKVASANPGDIIKVLEALK
jgi:hypothetical protein